MERKYNIWDIDEMAEEERKEILPYSKYTDKISVLGYLLQEGLVEDITKGDPDFYSLLRRYENGEPLLTLLAEDTHLDLFKKYAAHFSNDKLLENLHIEPKLVIELAERVRDEKISLNLVLENVNSEEKEVLFSNLLIMELQDRKEKLGSYAKLARFAEDHVGHHIVMSVPLLSLGTDEERDTEDYTIMPTDHLATVLNFSYYTSKNKKYIRDTIDYLLSKGVDIAKFINYYDTEEFFTRDHIIDYTTGIIGWILDYIGYDKELIDNLTNPEIIKIVNDYYTQI